MPLDFPSNPANGQIYEDYYYDATVGVWNSLGNSDIPNILSNGVFTASSGTTVPLTVNGASGQSANLQEWKSQAGSTLASVSANGGLSLNTPLSVQNGGTGASSLTLNGYLKGTGTSSVTSQSGIPAEDITSGSLATARGGTGATTGAGLVPVIPTSVSVGSGSASVNASGLITFTGASSVSVNGCFTSTYTNYRILFNESAASVYADGNMRLRASGTDLTSNYYRNGLLVDGATVSGFSNGPDSWFGNALTTHPSSSNAHAHSVIEIREPFVAKATTVQATNHTWNGSAMRFLTMGGFQNTAASYDGFTIILSSGNFGGTFRIYGYN